MIQKTKDFIKENKHALILIYWLIHYAWYQILQAVTLDRNPIAIACEADKLIPFSEWFIMPYVLWYVQIIAVTVYLLFRNKEIFTRLYIYMFGGMFVCMIICTLIPMYFDRTGIAMYPHDNLLTDCVKLLQGFDPPTTILPSMHVYVTVGLHIAVCKDKAFAENKLACAASAFFALAVCAATIFTKQHSLYDVVSALPLCAVMYMVAYLPKHKRFFKLLDIN